MKYFKFSLVIEYGSRFIQWVLFTFVVTNIGIIIKGIFLKNKTHTKLIRYIIF